MKRRDIVSLAAYGVPLLTLLSLCFWLTSLDFGDFRPESPTATYVLWALSTCVVFGAIALGFLLFRNLLKVYLQRQSNRPGSHLTRKLVTGVLALSIAPIALHVIYSISLLNRNFDKWFSQPTVEVLRSAERFMQGAQEELLDNLRGSAHRLAASSEVLAAFRNETTHEALKQALAETGADFVALSGTNAQGTRVDVSTQLGEAPEALPALADTDSLTARSGFSDGWLYATVPVDAGAGTSVALTLGRKLPAPISHEQAFMLAQVREWQQLEAARPVVWRTYVYILALVTMFMLFFAVWLAQFASKHITRPIEAVAAAADELAGGHLDTRVQTPAVDELGGLVSAFNRMGQALETKTGQLEQSNRDLAAANAEVEERRRFIDTILESITSGVVSVSDEGEILKYNEAARAFADGSELSSTESIAEVLDDEDRPSLRHMFDSARRTGIASREFDVERNGRSKHLMITVSSLDPDDKRGGFVVVLEDATELVRVQRSEAWQDAARRVAHEIKNPLTPIALAAGRIDRILDRIEDSGDTGERNELREQLKQSICTIDREVQSLRSLVDSFSDLARFPAIRPEDSDLNAVARDAVSVFDGRLPGVSLKLDTSPGTALARIDPEPFKRVIVNLIDNAAEVLKDSWLKQIVVSTRTRPESGTVELIVEDSGPGISDSNKEKLFLPYFSTKDRGTGLGLSIVRSVVQDHRGSIRVEDNEPTGTRFIIAVPAAHSEFAALERAAV